MKTLRNKTMATLIALFLMLSMTVSLVLLPLVNAHTPAWNYNTYCYVAPSADTVGVGQTILIVWWLNAVPPTAMGGTGDRWKVTVNVIKPDGTNDTLGPQASDPVGGNYLAYIPKQAGNYVVQAIFPGQTITGIPGQTESPAVGDYYGPSESLPAEFTVQQQPVPSYAETPLPTDYWTRPIYDANRGWGNAVMGQWLGQPWDTTLSRTVGVQNQGPLLSPHILWTRPAWTGGIMGGFGDTAFYNGIAYESFSSPLVCLDGRGYYSVNNPPAQGWYCINLYNGQTEYFQNNTDGTLSMPTYGQLLNYESPNQGGGFSYLWRTSGVTLPADSTSSLTWEMLDGYTGNAILKIANVSADGIEFRDDIGSICYLNIVNLGTMEEPNFYMQIWNTTQAIWWKPEYGISPPATLYNGTTNVPLTDTSNDYWLWRPGATTPSMFGWTGYGGIYDGNNGYSMNVSIASLLGPWNNIMVSTFFGDVPNTASILQIISDQYVIVGANGQNDARGTIEGFLRAISLATNTWGQTLWTTTFTPPRATDAYPNATYTGGVSFGGVDAASGTFYFQETVTGKQWVYSMTTGKQLWTNKIDSAWSYYGSPLHFHDGKAYTIGPSGMAGEECAWGVVTCFNATTGKFLWNWTAPSIGYAETQGSTRTPLVLKFWVDDPVTGHAYMYVDGSTPWAGQTSPIRRDSALFCVDCETGQTVWRLEAYPQAEGASDVVISDGHIIYLDNHDDNIYCLGKGSSATTVSAPAIVPTLGSSVMITGTVTDQTDSGRINVAGSIDFTLKGTPAISDASMAAWMEYMFQQRPIPTNATGVEVSLDTLDPNGNFVHIGNVTSDINGNYGYKFTPEVPGTYRIIATFAGSNSYGGSSATTYMAVDPAAPTASPYPEVVLPPIETYVISATIAIIIAIAIATVIIVLTRKRA